MMKPSHSGRFEFRLTLLQSMKLIIFAAIVSLCMTPAARLALSGVVPWEFVLMGAAVAAPLICAILAFPLIRKGPRKDRMIRWLLFTSVCAALGVAIYPLLLPSTIWVRSGATVSTMYFIVALLAGPFLMLLVSLGKRS